MLGSRYEEYLIFDDNLPFSFFSDIVITSKKYSSEANWHENIELQFCTEGSGYVLMDTKRHCIDKNQIAAVSSNVIHHTSTDNIIKYDCLIIDTAFCSKINLNTSCLKFEPVFKSDSLLSLYHLFKKIYEDKNNIYRIALLNKIIIEILIELTGNHTVGQNENTDISFKNIKAAIKYIRENYNKKLNLDLIASNSLMNKYTLSKEFKKATNLTVIQYVNSYRCKKAVEYISCGKTVSEAAQLCGFTNMSFFVRTFKKYMGRMPHSFKKKTGVLSKFN